jgi:hypothetical protein
MGGRPGSVLAQARAAREEPLKSQENIGPEMDQAAQGNWATPAGVISMAREHPPLSSSCSPVEEASRAPSCAALSFASMPRSTRGTGDALQPLHLWTGQGFPTSPVRAREPRLCGLSEASVVRITALSDRA